MRVTVLELPASWGAPELVLADVDAQLERGPATDLVVLPELSLTGYVSPDGDYNVSRFAEPLGGMVARTAAALAARRGVHLVAPLILSERGRCFNAAALFAPDGSVPFVYAKRHLWFPETWASRGEARPPIVRVEGVAVTIAICFDVHFLAYDAIEELRTADLLLFPSAWVDDEHDTRIPLLASLARRFDVAIANANWAPGVVCVRGQGGSCIIAADGTPLALVAPGASRADAVVGPR